MYYDNPINLMIKITRKSKLVYRLQIIDTSYLYPIDVIFDKNPKKSYIAYYQIKKNPLKFNSKIHMDMKKY